MLNYRHWRVDRSDLWNDRLIQRATTNILDRFFPSLIDEVEIVEVVGREVLAMEADWISRRLHS